MWRGWRRKRRVAKVKEGDGSSLPPFRIWQGLWRSQFSIRLPRDAADAREYVIDFTYMDSENKGRLYVGGTQQAIASLPAAFPVPGGLIEVGASMYGMTRIHYVTPSGEETQLTPHPRSGEAWRARLAARHPRVSAVIAAVAVVVLLASLVVLVPMVAAQISQIPPVAENVGSFTAPFDLPAWATAWLAVAAVVAALERALSLRHHWLIDLDTTFMGGD